MGSCPRYMYITETKIFARCRAQVQHLATEVSGCGWSRLRNSLLSDMRGPDIELSTFRPLLKDFFFTSATAARCD